MTEQEKLPKELPMIGDKYWDCFAQMELQRNADQLLYDALWAENERLQIYCNMLEHKYVNSVDKAELAKVRLDTARAIKAMTDSYTPLDGSDLFDLIQNLESYMQEALDG